MGTRGFVGFVADGREKIAYNHWDSYPEGLGADVLEWLRLAVSEGTEHVAERVRALRVVEPDSTPTPEDIESLRVFANQNVATKELTEWYVLLRHTQGNPAAILQAGVIEDASGFPADSLMCEWGYLLDMDTGRFEVYRGFQTEPHGEGRFADREAEKYADGIPQYHPVRLVASWPIAELPSREDFLAEFEDDEAS